MNTTRHLRTMGIILQKYALVNVIFRFFESRWHRSRALFANHYSIILARRKKKSRWAFHENRAKGLESLGKSATRDLQFYSEFFFAFVHLLEFIALIAPTFKKVSNFAIFDTIKSSFVVTSAKLVSVYRGQIVNGIVSVNIYQCYSSYKI